MRLRNVKGSKTIIENSKYIILNPSENKGNWNKIFNNDNEIHIEIGMGKGKFISEMAIKNPDVNFIGIEKFDSVIVRAVQKLEGKEIPNLKLIRMDAKELDKVFNHEISRIYLNFSDPWPKSKHEKRRLTSPEFLKIYDNIFKTQREIFMKTDNKKLFAYSLETLSQHGYKFKKITLDLKNENIDNVTTEYEDKFMENGITINRFEAIKE